MGPASTMLRLYHDGPSVGTVTAYSKHSGIQQALHVVTLCSVIRLLTACSSFALLRAVKEKSPNYPEMIKPDSYNILLKS